MTTTREFEHREQTARKGLKKLTAGKRLENGANRSKENKEIENKEKTARKRRWILRTESKPLERD